MFRLLPLLFTMACGSACGPTEVKVEDSAPPGIVSVDPPTPPDVIPGSDTDSDPYPWATWETCAHNIGDNPCNISLMDQHGEQVELYEHYGKVILLDLSAMWCGPCNMIAPYGEQWLQRYGEENFIWITVLLEDTTRDTVELSDLQAWAMTHGITLPVLAGSRDMIDVTEPLEDGYPVTAWPTLVVIDRGMTLQYGINGWNEVTIQTWVESLL